MLSDENSAWNWPPINMHDWGRILQHSRTGGAASNAARSTAAFYDQRGSRVLSSHQERFGSRFRDFIGRATRLYVESALPAPIPDRSKLLDLCCGTGAFSIYPAKIGYRVWGVDLSPQSIAAARAQAQQNGAADMCGFEVCDAMEFLRTTSLDFDAITVCGSLYYLDRKAVLPLIYDRLAPGGIFISMETNGSNSVMNAYRRLRAHFKRHRDSQTLNRLLRLEDYGELSRNFDDVTIRYFDFVTLLTPLLRANRALAECFYLLAQRFDDFLLNRLGLHSLAFKIVFVGKKQ